MKVVKLFKTREMDEMALPSRHRIRNSSPGGLRPSMLPLGHGGSQIIETVYTGWLERPPIRPQSR